MKKRIFSNLALALVLTIGVLAMPVYVAAAPSGLIQFDTGHHNTLSSLTGYIGDIVLSGSNAAVADPEAGISLSGITFQYNGLTHEYDYTDPGVVTAYQLFFDTGITGNSLSILSIFSELQITPGLTLMSGTFDSFTIAYTDPAHLEIDGTGLDIKDTSFLAALFQVDPIVFDPSARYQFDFSLEAEFNEFTGAWSVSEAEITNDISVTAQPVPEPATLLLLGLGLAGCGFFGRRKTKA